MRRPFDAAFSRRERAIMNVVYRLGEVGVSDVVEALGEPEAYDSVRVTLGILERKGHLRVRQEGNRNLYEPTVPAARARRSALGSLVDTFFEGSPSRAILALLDSSSQELSEAELEEIAALIEARRGGT